MKPTGQSWLPLVLLAMIIAFGTYLRSSNLGSGDFGVDELYQVFAAESLARGEGPRLPSGEDYRRGLDVTHVMRFTMERLGTEEYAARLPSTFFGVLSLFLFAGVLWQTAGAWAAVAGAALFAVYPEAVEQSRSVRFYTYQLSLGVCALYTGWRALERDNRTASFTERDRLRQWGWVVATLLFLALAARVQIVTLSVVAGWSMAVLAAAITDLRQRGRQAWRSSVAAQLVAAGIVFAGLALLVQGDMIEHLLQRARSVPFWVVSTEGGTHPLAYYYSLSSTYPLLLGLGPLIFLAAILRRPRLGVYMTIWFVVPMLLHSFWLPWKGERFVLIPMLGLFSAAAIAAAWGGQLLHEFMSARLGAYPRWAAYGSAVAAMAVGVIAITAYVTLPAFNQARKLPRSSGTSQWSASAAILRGDSALHALPFGQTRPLHPLYYWGKIDFLVSRARLVESVQRRADGEWEVEWLPGGSPDRSSGVPVLTRAEDIRRHFAEAGAVVIGVDADVIRRGTLEDDLMQVLTTEADELCRGSCGRMRLFVWRFSAAD